MSIEKRLQPLFIASFLQRFVFWYAIEKAFMTSIGFTADRVVFITILFTAVLLVANIPLGLLADRWSRKGSIMIGSVALAVASLICGLSTGVSQYALGMCFWGIYYASIVGAYDSIIYDALIETTGKSDKYERYFGRLQVYNGVAFISGSLLSGLIASSISLQASYLLSIPFILGAFIPLLLLQEPKLHLQETKRLISSHLFETLKTLIQSKRLLWIVLSSAFLVTSMLLMSEFGPLWFVSLSLPLILFGPVIALMQSSVSLGGYIATKLSKNTFQLRLAGLAVIAASTALYVRVLWMAILAQLLLFIGIMAFTIVLSKQLHDSVSSRVRAGSSSMVNTLGYLLFLPVAGLFGYISKHFSIFEAALLIVISITIPIIGLLVLTSSPVKTRRLKKQPA